MIVLFTATLAHEEDMFVASCQQATVASQGETVQCALANLREAVALYFDLPVDMVVVLRGRYGEK